MQAKNRKPKIAVLATFFWPVSGDVEDYPYNIARMLKEAKRNFEVLTPNIWPDGRKIARKTDNYKGIPIKRFPVFASITWFTKLWFPKFGKDTEIIHCCGGYRHPHMFIAFLRRGRAKFLLSPFYPMHPRKNPLIKIAAGLIDSTIGKYVISHSACCFAETKQEAEWLEKLGAKKVVILPNSLPNRSFVMGNSVKFRKKHGIKGKMLFSLGRQVPIKNFEEIISIMPQLNATLVIGGEETGYTKKCMKLAKELNVEKRIIWAGFMNSEQKRDAYTACNIYICSSIRESLGTTVLEAMAQGKPVIATDAGGIPEIVPDKFCIYKQGNKDELIQKVNELFKNEKLASRIGKKGKEKAQKYRFSIMKSVYLKTLENLDNRKQ
ncbi:MAG: glycosyltransferase family 4 protein [archaeon]